MDSSAEEKSYSTPGSQGAEPEGGSKENTLPGLAPSTHASQAPPVKHIQLLNSLRGEVADEYSAPRIKHETLGRQRGS